MPSLVLMLAAASLGVDYGWQPAGDDGDLEYIIQIEPAALESLRSGRMPYLSSRIPPEVRGVRRFRIQIGTDELPREGVAPRVEDPIATLDPPVEAPVPLVFVPNPASRPLVHQKAVYFETADEEENRGEIPPEPATSTGSSDPREIREAQATDSPTDEAPKPWWPLAFTLLGLFASLGGNVYLGWIAWDMRGRYRAALIGHNS